MTSPPAGPEPVPGRYLRATAIGFIVGSALFAVGVPLSLTALPAAVAAWTFVAGSVFFTSAALLQLLASWERRPRSRPDWVASAVQLVGTVAFNVTTVRAALDASGARTISAAVVWRPDAVGSVLFLVSSGIAMAPEVRWHRHAHARDRSWAIATLNLAGSVLFGASAIGAWTVPSSDALLSEWWSNVGTVGGAICFLAGAVLLLPRRARGAANDDLMASGGP